MHWLCQSNFTGVEDFVSLPLVFEITIPGSPTNRLTDQRLCQPFQPLDDAIDEDNETISAVIVADDPFVQLFNSTIMVTILDNDDGNYY